MSLSIRLLLLICLVYFNWSCQPEKSKSDVEENKKTFSPVIMDTIGLNKTNFIFEGDDERWMTEANYNDLLYRTKKRYPFYVSAFRNYLSASTSRRT